MAPSDSSLMEAPPVARAREDPRRNGERPIHLEAAAALASRGRGRPAPGLGQDVPGRPGADLDSVVGFMAAKLGADSALLTVYDGRPGEPHIYCARGLPMGQGTVERVAGFGSNGDALTRGKPIARRLRANSQNGNGNGAGGRGRNGDRADAPVNLAQAFIVPVRAPSGTTGALSIGYLRPLGRKRETVLRAATSYAALLGLWLDDAASLVRLLRSAYKDGLTGCLTFAALMQELDQEVRRCERSGQPLACLVIDLDGFNEVNECVGHAIGNFVLAAVAGRVLKRVRHTDIVGRYGGDEFVIALPDTGSLGASTLAGALRSEIGEAAAGVIGTPVDASVGVAEWTAGTTPTELVDHADAALRYERLGRTRPR